jgi:hypothetical protein
MISRSSYLLYPLQQLFFAIDGGLDGIKSKQGFDDWKCERGSASTLYG